MKALANVSFLVVAMVVSTVAFGAKPDDKQIEKARVAVENAAPDDWKTLAEAAEKCIRKNKNMKEATKWLNKSIEIKETAYNLEVKGDYYLKNKMPREAMLYYVKSMKKAREVNFGAENTALETKITKAKALQSKIG